MFENLFKKKSPNPFSKEFPTPPLTQDVANNLNGIEAEKSDETDEAIRMYEQNVAAGFDGSHPYKRLAIIYRKQKKYDDEIRVLKAAIKVFSKANRSDTSSKLEWFKDRLKKAEELKAKE